MALVELYILIKQKRTIMTSTQQKNTLDELSDLVRNFVSEREWGQFHTPKNLASALCVEASELLEPFQWLKSGCDEELSDEKRTEIRHEMADVFLYLLMLADKMEVDLIEAAKEKMALNANKYPLERAR